MVFKEIYGKISLSIERVKEVEIYFQRPIICNGKQAHNYSLINSEGQNCTLDTGCQPLTHMLPVANLANTK